jgi:hypothetical protein
MVQFSIHGMLESRVYFSNIEWAFARDLPDLTDIDNYRSFFSEFLAVCMQPKSVCEDYNFLQRTGTTNKETVRSRLAQVLRALKNDREFWTNEGIDVDQAIEQIRFRQKTVARISQKDFLNCTSLPDFSRHAAEFYHYLEDGKLKSQLSQTAQQRKISIALLGIVEALNTLKKSRKAFTEAQINNVKVGADEHGSRRFSGVGYDTAWDRFNKAWSNE